MNNKKLYNWIINVSMLLATVIISTSCSSDNEDVVTPLVEPRLKSSQMIFVRSAADLRGLIEVSGLDLPFERIIYDVQVWNVTYQTMYGDQEVTASGMVFIPETEEKVPFLSYQHGTLADNASVPSEAPLNDDQNFLLASLSGIGFITVAPDYIGFGSSVDIVHPFYVEQPTRDAILDNLRASVELAVANESTLSNRLYLLGYSQGGYATMAAHKGIEELGLEFFELQASFPSSGGYDIIGMRDYFLSLETYGQPFYLAYVLEGYRNYYGWDEGTASLFFQEPYASIIPDLFDGSLSGSEINNMLTENISDYINSEFITDPENEAFDFLNEKFEENSLLDWTPLIPMHMYHGDADITVPYQNSVDSFDRLLSNGANESVLTFTTIPGATHGSGFLPYLFDLVDELIDAAGS